MTTLAQIQALSIIPLLPASNRLLCVQLGEKLDREWSEHGNIVFVARFFTRIEEAKANSPTPTQNDRLFQSGRGSGGVKSFSILKDELADAVAIVFALYNIDQSADSGIEYTCAEYLCMGSCIYCSACSFSNDTGLWLNHRTFIP